MKIIFFEVRSEEREALEKIFNGMEAEFLSESLNSETASRARDAEIISIFVHSRIDAELIDLLPNLKLIATRSTGFDHIDLVSAKKRGIVVSTVPSYGAHTVAEFAFGLIISLSRKIFGAAKKLKEDQRFDVSGFEGFDLYGKTLGVIGTGRIGKNVARIAKGFGMKVVGTDLMPDNSFAEEIDLEYVPLNVALAVSDIISIHLPLTDETLHIINSKNILEIKRGAIIINTARGEILETEALINALRSGQISGAGLDVLEGERDGSFDGSLIEMPNVIVTPHIAFYSKEAVEEIIKISAENIKSFMNGNPQNIVNQ